MDAPVLQPGLQFYFAAFLSLSSCRPVGMSEGRIPWTAVAMYADRYDMDEEELTVLWTLVCEMDSCYLRHVQKKGKIADKPVSDKQKGPQIIPPPRKTR